MRSSPSYSYDVVSIALCSVGKKSQHSTGWDVRRNRSWQEYILVEKITLFRFCSLCYVKRNNLYVCGWPRGRGRICPITTDCCSFGIGFSGLTISQQNVFVG